MIQKLVNEKEEIITREKNNKVDLVRTFESFKKMLIENINAKENEIKILKSKLPLRISAEEKMTLIFISNDKIIHYSFL